MSGLVGREAYRAFSVVFTYRESLLLKARTLIEQLCSNKRLFIYLIIRRWAVLKDKIKNIIQNNDGCR